MNLAKNKARDRKIAYIFIKKNLSSAKIKHLKKPNRLKMKTFGNKDVNSIEHSLFLSVVMSTYTERHYFAGVIFRIARFQKS